MENATKALEIAAGVLLGVIILAVIVYFFGSISLWPEEQDDLETAEQLSKFNLEYEVYDKKAMYGTDVISCLTKAQSNNQKYVEGGFFLSGNRYGDEYFINVYVHINSNLKESLTVYRIQNSVGNSAQQVQIFTLSNDNISDQRLSEIRMNEMGFKIEKNDEGYTNFKPDSKIKDILVAEHELEGEKYIYTKSEFGPDGKYNAQLYNGRDMNTPLNNLIKFASDNAKQVVYNTNSNPNIGVNVWNTAIWQTGLYDFKTRRFKCDSIGYSEKTGRVNEICFSEI